MTPVSAAKRHSVDQSATFSAAALCGPEGLPSNMHTVVPPSSAPICEFHMIQPVELCQKYRSPVSAPGPTSLCRAPDLSASTITPPWPWTMALGRPVVPLEYTIQSGWSKGSGWATKAASPSSKAPKSWQRRCGFEKASATGPAPTLRQSTRSRTLGSSAISSRSTTLRSWVAPPFT